MHNTVLLCFILCGLSAGAPRVGVVKHGTTLPPNFVRKQGQSASTCPKEHPYAINNFKTCCASSTESNAQDCNQGEFVHIHTTEACCEPSIACPGNVCRGTAEGTWSTWSSWTTVGPEFCPEGSIIHTTYERTSNCAKADGYSQICTPPGGVRTEERHTPIKCKAYTKVAIFGGRKNSESGSVMVHLLDTKDKTVCRLTDLPQVRYANPTGLLKDGKAVTCAGSNLGTEKKECFTYLGETNTWDTTSIPSYPNFVVNPATAQLPQGGFMVIGGATAGAGKRQFLYYDGPTNSFKSGPPLPIKRHWPCATLLNSTHVLVGGGSSENLSGHQADILVLDVTKLPDATWEVLETLPLPRNAMYCGTINQKNDLEVVFAGGQVASNVVSNRVDILNMASMTWRQGPNLPKNLCRGGSTQIRDTMIILGGITATSNANDVSTIYELDWLNSKWIQWQQELDKTLRAMDAITVPDTMYSCP